MTDTKESHSEAQAKAKAESIVAMVRALDRETAAEDWLESATEKQVQDFLAEHDVVLKADEDAKETALELMTARFPEDPDGFEFDEEEARQAIQEDALSAQVRSGWCDSKEDMEPEEFCILLCTGGPAVRIRGELDRGEPSRAWIEHQDWGTPWTEFHGDIEQDTLLTYCRQFYFGE